MKKLLVGLCVGLSSLAALAQATPAQHTVRFGGGFFLPTGDVDISIRTGDDDDLVDVSNRNEFKSTFGVAAGYEYRFNDLVGIDVGARYYRPEVERSRRTGSLAEDKAGFLPITAGAMFHFGEVGRFSFYAGPQLVWVLYTDPDLDPDIDIDYSFDDEITWGVKGGVDYQVGNGPWGVSAVLEYIDAAAETKGGPKLRPNPLLVSFGAVYRF